MFNSVDNFIDFLQFLIDLTLWIQLHDQNP